MLAADVGFVDDGIVIDPELDFSEPAVDVEAPPADLTQEFVPVLMICPEIPDLPTIDLPAIPEVDPIHEPEEVSETAEVSEPEAEIGEPEAEFLETEDYLKEFNRFLAANPDWLADHGADGIQLCVMTPSQYVDGVELSNPGEARAFDAWFEQEHPWFFVEPIIIDDSINFDDLILVEDPIATEDPVEFDETARERFVRGFPQISYNLMLSFVRDSSADYFSWALATVPSSPAEGTDFGFTTGVALTGTYNVDGLSWLSMVSGLSDFGGFTLTVTGGEIVQQSSVEQQASIAPTVATPFDYKQAAYAQFAASFMGGSSNGGNSGAESLPGGGGRRRARA